MPSFCFTNQTLTGSHISILKWGVAANKNLKNAGTGERRLNQGEPGEWGPDPAASPDQVSAGLLAFSPWPRESRRKGHNDGMLFQGLLEAPVERDTENKSKTKKKQGSLRRRFRIEPYV